MKKFYGHLSTITKHKLRVSALCFRCGLYKRGILHDLSKYSWIEFSSGVKYFQGNRSPIDKEKEILGYSKGWLHHKGRNKHHWEYWIDNCKEGGVAPLEMPIPFVIEMFCDRVAASEIYMKDKYTDDCALQYFLRGKSHTLMHPKTEQLLQQLLTYLKDHGIDKTLHYIRNTYIKGTNT